MRLDTQLRAFILAIWDNNPTRLAIVDILRQLPEPRSVVCARFIQGNGVIDKEILVVTEDRIGYGWPMDKVLWEKK